MKFENPQEHKESKTEPTGLQIHHKNKFHMTDKKLKECWESHPIARINTQNQNQIILLDNQTIPLDYEKTLQHHFQTILISKTYLKCTLCP